LKLPIDDLVGGRGNQQRKQAALAGQQCDIHDRSTMRALR